MKNYFGIAAISVLMACSSNPDKSKETKDTIATNAVTAPASNISFKEDTVQALYNSYIKLKDALVASKFDDAKSEAKTLQGKLKSYSGCENTSLIANKIENAKDIVDQRKQFTSLSSDVIALFKHADLKTGTVFVQHCPMANKGEGGDWLASEKKIQNPYYGSEMMECGAVIEEIKSK
ncbi:MAG: DUF3347 domain-containing protein [Pedobacter sp.]|nr:MAG: DUF3347 domain-containing protein [Pedobacter sp.]